MKVATYLALPAFVCNTHSLPHTVSSQSLYLAELQGAV